MNGELISLSLSLIQWYRTASIILNEDNTHFLRVDKDDFNRVLRDVEANTVKFREFGKEVLLLEKIPINVKTSDGTYQVYYKWVKTDDVRERLPSAIWARHYSLKGRNARKVKSVEMSREAHWPTRSCEGSNFSRQIMATESISSILL